MKTNLAFVLLGLSLCVQGVVSQSAIPQTTSSDEPSCKVKLERYSGISNIRPSIPKSHAALLLLLGFAGFSLLIAGAYKASRKYVFHDDGNFDTAFDAGGRVSLSLTAVTVTSQMLWPADFLQGTTLTSKTGIGVSLWTSIAIVVDILLFPMLSLYLKSRAPGAKTYPQIAYARFGKSAHILFCCVAIFSSVIVTTSVLLAGKSTFEGLVKDTNNEFIFLVLAVLFGSYCMIGGLGTTFYISYLNTALTFVALSVYILYSVYFPPDENKSIASIDTLYNAAVCVEGPDGNYSNSLATFRSKSGIVFGVVLLIMATSISFTDQANWQSRIAAKPAQGVIGFFLAAYIWFVVQPVLAVTTTMSYFSLSLPNSTHILSSQEIDSGYITPYVMSFLMGDTGAYLLLTMVMMALMSTGSGEVMAISSIIVYDIYKTYINPFRKLNSPSCCLLCGKEKQLIETTGSDSSMLCTCTSVIGCMACEEDVAAREKQGAEKVTYTCSIHGKYRKYEDGLMRYKSWCMVWVVILIVPYGLLVSETNMNVNWATLSLQVLTCPFLVPLISTISWSKTTSKGVISGCVTGLGASVAGMMIMGSTYEGGLVNFYVNTAHDYSLLTSMIAGLVTSAIVTIGVSLCTNTIRSEEDSDMEWAKTISIDNPLSPFRLVYEEELAKLDVNTIITARIMDKVFRKARLVAVLGGVLSLVLFVVILPAVALSFDVLSLGQFSSWLKTYQIYCFVCTFVVVVFPPFEEGYQIWKRCQKNKANTSNQNRQRACYSGNTNEMNTYLEVEKIYRF
ncbi:uncharacterized protein LOC127878035 [Dreissena polymorpha]|uniref:Uncharacterized protein n=1 Tax=Dreissena polymorpha TaxID=45954 RepID=A0A9D4QV31_DREPO|nr:uncharacterized protein LOC127878035 [Dreissena polymorpha]KAH3843782.1 hypothetical protein DPMN_117313 [Dreissena polymorpha]